MPLPISLHSISFDFCSTIYAGKLTISETLPLTQQKGTKNNTNKTFYFLNYINLKSHYKFLFQSYYILLNHFKEIYRKSCMKPIDKVTLKEYTCSDLLWSPSVYRPCFFKGN